MTGRRRDRWYYAAREEIARTVREQGWTCDMHEPDADCDVCQQLHLDTAEAILELRRPPTVSLEEWRWSCPVCPSWGTYGDQDDAYRAGRAHLENSHPDVLALVQLEELSGR